MIKVLCVVKKKVDLVFHLILYLIPKNVQRFFYYVFFFSHSSLTRPVVFHCWRKLSDFNNKRLSSLLKHSIIFFSLLIQFVIVISIKTLLKYVFFYCQLNVTVMLVVSCSSFINFILLQVCRLVCEAASYRDHYNLFRRAVVLYVACLTDLTKPL